MKHFLLSIAAVIAVFVVASLASAEAAHAQASGVPGVVAAAAEATTLTLPAVQDTYVDSMTPGVAFAEDTTLRVARNGITAIVAQRTYLDFDLSAIPRGALVQSAALDLYQSRGSADAVLLYRVGEAWDATKTTWNNQPPSVTLGAWRPPATENEVVTYADDALTALVQEWVNAPTRAFGLMLDSGAPVNDLREFHSLENASRQSPQLRVTFVLPPIRVCDDPDCLKPASGVDLYNVSTDKLYTTDAAGYGLDDGAIQLGDVLWARAPGEVVANGAFYRTSGAPQRADAAAFVAYPGLNLPEMRLVLGTTLFARDLQASAQWNLEGDPAYKAKLARRLVDASDHLYRFTAGQFALGRITVYQDYARWDAPETDLWLHSSNTMRPLSYIKGEVAASTPDPNAAVEFVYEPGPMYIGSEWNRYGAPPAQPLPPGVDVSRDWAAALAHELGHYLLGQFDSYIAVLPSGVATETFACTGSAMGWVYGAANQAFVWDEAHWAAACGNTLGAFNVKRTEWATIQAWYTWAQAPVSATPYTAVPPLSPTTVTFVAPAGPPPLVSQTFDLAYQVRELASAEARAFLLRDVDADGVPDRILDQGRPPQGVTPPQVTLTGAQASDRLCVIDINDFAELPETPRHQFGCEVIEAGDNALTMRRDPAWAPVITVTPLSPTEMGISVTTTSTGAPVLARLYPEHGATPTPPLALTPGEDGWSGVFTVVGLTPSAFVQIWVDEAATEATPRREAIVDYGVGGGAVPGPKQKIGFAPVTSSDGKAFFLLPATLSLTADQFVAIQSMAGTLPLPPATFIYGQPYRLIALPPTLVDAGSINIYLANGAPGAAAATAQEVGEARALYFWDGATWEKLPTILSSDADGAVLASAASRGVGVYALLIEAPDRLYLPMIRQ